MTKFRIWADASKMIVESDVIMVLMSVSIRFCVSFTCEDDREMM